MPKGKPSIKREKLIELVRSYPELYNAKNNQPANQRACAKAWTLIADALNSTVTEVQRTWQQIVQRNSKRQSLRSGMADNLDFLPNVEFFNEISCASSAGSSPIREGKRSTRSISVISTASEAENSRSSKSMGGTVTRDQRKSRRGKSESLSQESRRESLESQTIEYDSSAHESRQASVEKSMRSSVTEESPLTSKQRRISTPTLKEKMQEFNVSDPTRIFFESMGMTVSTFPQHIQANLKVEICKIVAKMEFKLSMPTPC